MNLVAGTGVRAAITEKSSNSNTPVITGSLTATVSI